MKILAAILTFILITCFNVHAQDTLKMVNWNIEYFGERNSHPPRQVEKVISIMQHINADVYALVEIVNVDSLQKVKQALGTDYEVVISTYGSMAPDVHSPYYKSALKMALLYRKSKIQIHQTRGFMANSTTAYFNWASGRVPFLVEASVKIGSQWQRVDFQVLHAKAMADNNSCARRTAAGIEWKDSLDRYKSDMPFILLGDWNDDFDNSICSGSSNYTYMVSDSTDQHNYFSPTLQLSAQGISSISGYPSFIDHVIISDELREWYVPNSAQLLKTEVNQWVSSYTHDVSDHYPVQTLFMPRLLPLKSNPISDEKAFIYPNPADEYFIIRLLKMKDYALRAFDERGNLVLSKRIRNNSIIPTLNWANGRYFLKLQDENGEHQFSKIVVNH